MKLLVLTLVVMLLLVRPGAFAGTSVEQFQADWAIANYQLDGDAQEDMFKTLVERIDRAVAASPEDPELLIWQGIIKSTWAGKVGGLAALGLVKEARRCLEKALELDDTAMNGSAYTSLGALYYQVPGWPIAFGNNKKARKLLERAIELNPDGIDSNYFFGEFLFQENEYELARQRLERALNAPARSGRELADSGRRKEILTLLAKVTDRLDS